MLGLCSTVGRAIHEAAGNLADRVVERLLARTPELASAYGPQAGERLRADAVYHLRYLANAVGAGEPALFRDYVGWAKVLHAGVGLPTEHLAIALETTRQALLERLEPQAAQLVSEYVAAGLGALSELPSTLPSHLAPSARLGELAEDYLQALLRGEKHAAARMILQSVAAGIPIRDIYLHVFQSVLYEVGRLWQMRRITVAQEHYCTAATQLIMSQLYEHVFDTERAGLRMAAACVEGELHELGIRMICDFFELEGWDTYYLGANTPAVGIVEMVLERQVHLLAISASLTPHVCRLAETIRQVRLGLGEMPLAIMAGGHPFNVAAELWKRVGADATAGNALEAVRIGTTLVCQGRGA